MRCCSCSTRGVKRGAARKLVQFSRNQGRLLKKKAYVVLDHTAYAAGLIPFVPNKHDKLSHPADETRAPGIICDGYCVELLLHASGDDDNRLRSNFSFPTTLPSTICNLGTPLCELK